ncbi:unnamed protein product [Darwinula stevensoni]|uniref:Methyltransferase domain-containing protein n=1 Tax=Darwinula stevensoni TaxID=69355 RepID=A0A7R9A2I1_9CRUS|nr:unnamed protein product [Darwinula stevensoni]CAG0879994.1 unnamed protein product [Darwinula stevensoni]
MLTASSMYELCRKARMPVHAEKEPHLGALEMMSILTAKETSRVISAYDANALQYEQDFNDRCYKAPRLAAEAIRDFIQVEDRSKVKIMDIAAGTGKVGEWLARFGFRDIDALDGSRGMLDTLTKRNIYGRKIHDTIGYHRIDVEDETYDAVSMSAGFVEGHVPVAALDEMLRISKKGGIVVVVLRYEYLWTVEEYRDLEPYMRSMEERGLWTMLLRNITAEYFYEKEGITYVFRKL